MPAIELFIGGLLVLGIAVAAPLDDPTPSSSFTTVSTSASITTTRTLPIPPPSFSTPSWTCPDGSSLPCGFFACLKVHPGDPRACLCHDLTLPPCRVPIPPTFTLHFPPPTSTRPICPGHPLCPKVTHITTITCPDGRRPPCVGDPTGLCADGSLPPCVRCLDGTRPPCRKIDLSDILCPSSKPRCFGLCNNPGDTPPCIEWFFDDVLEPFPDEWRPGPRPGPGPDPVERRSDYWPPLPPVVPPDGDETPPCKPPADPEICSDGSPPPCFVHHCPDGRPPSCKKGPEWTR